MAKSRVSKKEKLSKAQLGALSSLDLADLIGLHVRCRQLAARFLHRLNHERKQNSGGELALSELKAYLLEPYPVAAGFLNPDQIAKKIGNALKTKRRSAARKAVLPRDLTSLGEAANIILKAGKWNWRERTEAFLGRFPTTFEELHSSLHYEATVYRLSRGSADCAEELKVIARSWRQIVKEREEMWGRDGHVPVYTSFAGQYYTDTPLAHSSVLRVSEWGNIRGFADEWDMVAQQWEDHFRSLSYEYEWPYLYALTICRSETALRLCSSTLWRNIGRILRKNPRPWVTKRWQKESQIITFYAGELAFANAMLKPGSQSLAINSEALDFLLRSQQLSGGWVFDYKNASSDAPTHDIATAMAIHALVFCKPSGWEIATQMARDCLLEKQSPSGYWLGSGGLGFIWPTVFILDAIELANGGTQVTFKLPTATALDASENKVSIAEVPSDKPLPERFTFAPGQAMFDGRDLGMGTGVQLSVLKKLVGDFGKVVPFKQLDRRSLECAGSEKIRTAITRIRRVFKKEKIPAKIGSRMREGYIILPT